MTAFQGAARIQRSTRFDRLYAFSGLAGVFGSNLGLVEIMKSVLYLFAFLRMHAFVFAVQSLSRSLGSHYDTRCVDFKDAAKPSSPVKF